MLTRRLFLGSISVPAAGLALGARPSLAGPAFARSALDIARELAETPGQPDELARDEDFWTHVGRAFTVDRSVVNLNNGGVSPSPAFVQDAMKRHLDFSNSTPPPVSLWRILQPQREHVRERLARHWGADPGEIAITRNSSEALQICQLGIDLKPGDEILTTTQDYPRMLTTFRQRARREGVVLREIRIPVPCENDDEVVRLFREGVTDRTKMILMSHIVNITGQILPVRQVVAMARGLNSGIPVIVDGAHALAHFQFQLPDLGCDYYGVSLHKWLFAPHGTGLLYVRRDKIKSLWPLMAAPDTMDDDIRKFEEIGTHPLANVLAIAEALTFHQGLGDARKEARLRFLRDTWAKRLMKLDRVRLHTSLDRRFSCAIGTVEIDGVDPGKLSDWLWSTHRILTAAINHAEFKGVRITPSVYTTSEELDRFCDAMTVAATRGIESENAP